MTSLQSIASLLVVVGLTCALHAPRAVAAAPGVHVVVEQGLVTVDARDAWLEDVVRLVGERAGVRVTILGRLDTRLTESFARLSVGDAIARLVRGHSFALAYSSHAAHDAPPPPTDVFVVGASADRRTGASAGTATPSGQPTVHRVGGQAGAVEPIRDSRAPGHAHPAVMEIKDRAARVQSLLTLGRQGDERALAELTAMLADDPNPLVRSQAAAVLGLAGASGANALTSALSDGNGSVRLHAARALGSLGDLAAVPALQKLAGSDPDPRVRRVAVRSLGGLLREQAGPILTILAADPDASVRREVDWALSTWTNRRR